MYEGCQPCYPKPLDKAKKMRPDSRGTCGCFQGPRYCKFIEGLSWEDKRDWIKAAEECQYEVEQE
eukprot:5147736-Karenia_brevis.AAC.1